MVSHYDAADSNVQQVNSGLLSIGDNAPVHQATFDVACQQVFATIALTQAVLAVADELRGLRQGGGS